jgi:hypothetical protein
MPIGFLTMAVVIAGAAVSQENVADKQRSAATVEWKRLFDDETPAVEETAHFLIVAAAPTPAARLREIGSGFEARFNVAAKALKLDAQTELWPGKLTIYLIPNRNKFASFVRTFAKQRVSPDDVTVSSLKGATPFIAASSGSRPETGPEVHAAELIATTMLAKHGGDVVPAWLLAGFGRATSWRAAPATANTDRVTLKKVIRGKTAANVWDGQVNASDAAILRASLAEFLAFGPTSNTFPQFIGALKPSENARPVSVAEALKATSYTPDRLTRDWHAWVARGR